MLSANSPSSTMNLLNFPYLVQKEILMKIAYSDLFSLSFTSRKVQILIRSIQRREVFRINYHAGMVNSVSILHVDGLIQASVRCESKKPDYIKTMDVVKIDGKHLEVW
uniref:F-box domain-containing protein n=2 Tax=Caenorhabditis tropicalis TaxID=1561998 RepID=A0A1I7SYE2_9PELO